MDPDWIMARLPSELRTRVYFEATQKWRDAAVRIQSAWRGYAARWKKRYFMVLIIMY